ncbi:MAG: hypothetical protein JWN48_3518, partial [Myxococcaceae bacterium]|nr:hypothetical protein [Myxococcaceae bacterium]
YTRAARIILAPPDRDSLELTQSALRGAVRAERMLPEPLWKLTAPLVRPLASRLVYGNSQAILGSLGDVPGKQPRRTHLAVRLLRPWVWRRERARLAGRLGSDLQIALSQRAAYQRQLARVKAAERPFAPREADGVSPARPELCSGP